MGLLKSYFFKIIKKGILMKFKCLLTFAIVTAAFQAQAEECSLESVLNVASDKSTTTLQKEVAIDELCKGKAITFTGKITDVERSGIDLLNDQRKRFVARLDKEHGCGDLTLLSKGDEKTLQGILIRYSIVLGKFRVKEAKCVSE